MQDPFHSRSDHRHADSPRGGTNGNGAPPRRAPAGRRAAAGGNSDAIRGAAEGRPRVVRPPVLSSPADRTSVTFVSELPALRTKEHGEATASENGNTTPGGRGGGHRLSSNWKRALAAGLICFCVWTLLDAPTLMNSAVGSTLGARRTVAMDILRPIAWLSRETGLSHVVGAADRLLGRSGSGAVLISSGPPGGSHTSIPPTTVPPTTIVTTPQGKKVTKRVVLADGFPPFPHLTARAPLRVLIVGDSVGTDLGQYALVDDLGRTGVVSATLDGHIATGLTRPDYFNWPEELHNDLVSEHPQLVIVCIGANDAQNTIVNGRVLVYGTQAWDNMYSSRIGAFIAEATSTGSRVLWVGMPPMASSQLNAQMQHLDYLYQTQVSRHIGAEFLSSVPALGGRGGIYTAFKTVQGSSALIRTDDGIHLEGAGAELLSKAVISDMDKVYNLHLRP